jgi:cellulose synthase/poly-beta-1,6-N-acetylglucosamine synthase-like glycosyltransferase
VDRPDNAKEEMIVMTTDITSEDTAFSVEAPPRICVVIPTLNEVPSISRVVEGLRRQTIVPLDRVIGVDNGSTDGTGERARQGR